MARIIGPAAAGIPWQERPAGNTEPVWRYTNNPIIERDAVPRANSIFNSAVVPFRDGYAGVFRVDDTSRLQTLHRGFSKDGIHWELDKDQIAFISDDPGSRPFCIRIRSQGLFYGWPLLCHLV